MVKGHQDNTADQKQIKAKSSLPGRAHILFSSQLNNFPDSAASVVEIGNLNDEFHLIFFELKIYDLGKLPRNGRFAIFPGLSQRTHPLPVYIDGVRIRNFHCS